LFKVERKANAERAVETSRCVPLRRAMAALVEN